jgi:hypothetical protein
MMPGDAGGLAAEAALAAWLEALARFGETEAVSRAVEPDVTIERVSGRGARAGEVVEIITGSESAARWLGLTPTTLGFRLAGPPRPCDEGGGPGWQVGYTVSGEGFENGGLWRLRLGPSGRIAWLRHVPRPLAGPTMERVPPGPTAPRVLPDPTTTHAGEVRAKGHRHPHHHGCGSEAEVMNQGPHPR